jgi:delta 1-pyrroline-5-carboxylate dehydrogenase
MATFEDLEASSDSDDEEANMALMATADEDSEGSDSDESDSDESEQVFLNYSKEQLLTYLGMSLSKFAESSSKLKLLKTQKDELAKKAEHFQALYKNSLIKIEELENGCTRCNKPTDEHEVALQEFVHQNVNKSKMASMIYSVCKNKGEGIGYSYGKQNSYVCLNNTPDNLYSTFVPAKNKGKAVVVSDSEGISGICKTSSEVTSEVVSQNPKESNSGPKHSEPETVKSKTLKILRLRSSSNQTLKQTKLMINNQHKTLVSKTNPRLEEQPKFYSDYQSKPKFQKH